MNKQNITEKQRFHQRSLMGKGSYAPGIKQSYKQRPVFSNGTFFKHVKETLLATNYLQ